ncbi:MAG: hypothetical protein WA584_23690 [Pyrinomonadaceae bacterium]
MAKRGRPKLNVETLRIEAFVKGIENIKRFKKYQEKAGFGANNSGAANDLIRKALDIEIPAETVSAI